MIRKVTSGMVLTMILAEDGESSFDAAVSSGAPLRCTISSVGLQCFRDLMWIARNLLWCHSLSIIPDRKSYPFFSVHLLCVLLHIPLSFEVYL